MSRSARPGPSVIRRSEPPRRSTRHRSQATQSTDNSGAEDLPYLPTAAPLAADHPSAFRRARSAQSARAHRKTASFSRIVNLDVEVDVESALNGTRGQSRRSRDEVDEETRSERTERSVRRRYSSTVDNDHTPRGANSKKRKFQVRQSLGVSQVLGEMTLDRRADMVSDVARDCLVKLLAISRKGGVEEARKAWDSLQILRHTYMFSKHAPPFADFHSFVSALHPGNAYNPLVLSHALDLSNICTFIYTILFPDEAADLLKDMDPYFLGDTYEGKRSGSGKGKGREERLSQQVEDRVKRRNQLLLMAWKKFWVVVIPREMRGSDSALELWLDFATMIIRTWQSPTIFPISPPHSSLPEIPEVVLTDILSASAVTRFGQWELSDDPDPSNSDATDQANQDDSERSEVIRRWRDLAKRRKQVLAERTSMALSRQFDWARFTGELCAFVRVELAEGGYLPAGVNVKRADSEISVKRRLSSNTSNPTPSRYTLGLPRQTEEALTGDDEDEDDVDMETADSALEESEVDDGAYDLPEPSKQVMPQGDLVDFDMLKDLAMEMDEEAEELAQNRSMKRDPVLSSRRSTLSPKKRTSTASPRKSRSSLPILREEDGYSADIDTLRDHRAAQMARHATRSSKHSISPVRPEEEEWAIRDMLPPAPGQASSSQAAGPSRLTFNFAARQENAERVDWDSQTPIRREMNGRAGVGEVIQRDYAEDRNITPRPRDHRPRLSPTGDDASAVPDPLINPVVAAGVHTPRRKTRDPTQEFVPTPGIFHEEEEAEKIEVLENIGLTEDRPTEMMTEVPIAAEDSALPELARPLDGGISGSSEMLRTPSQDIDDILPDPAILRLRPESTVSREVSRAPGAGESSTKRPNGPIQEDEDEGDNDIVYIEQPVRPTAQGAFISSRPRSSTRPGDFVLPTAEEEEADRRLLSHPATPRHRQFPTTTDIKPMRDPDFLIAPGLRRQSNQRASSRAPFARVHSVQPAEPDLDPYLYDENGEPLEEDEEYVLPLDYSPQRSMLHGPTGQQSSSYSRISGKRKWTKPEEILLYRTVQKVPLREEYPLRVVWYLHGEFGVLSKTLADFNPQHMKDKMRVIVSARYNQRKPVLGRARFWLPTGHPDKEALAAEMAEWKARDTADKLAENERIRIAREKAKNRKKARKSKSKGKKRAREKEETEEDELESEEGEEKRDGVPETADEGEAADQDDSLEELGTPTTPMPSKGRSSARSTPKKTPKKGKGRPRRSKATVSRKSNAKPIAAPQTSKWTGPSDRQKRAEARAEAARQAAGEVAGQQAEDQDTEAEGEVGDAAEAVQEGYQDVPNTDDQQQSEDGGDERIQAENDIDNSGRPEDLEAHIEQDPTIRNTRSRSRTASRPPATASSGSTVNQPAQPVRRMRSVRGRAVAQGGLPRIASEGYRKGRSSTCEVVIESRRPTDLDPVQEGEESQDLERSQEEVEEVEELDDVKEGSVSGSGGEDEGADDAASPKQQDDGGEEGEVEGQDDADEGEAEGETLADEERIRREMIERQVKGQQQEEERLTRWG